MAQCKVFFILLIFFSFNSFSQNSFDKKSDFYIREVIKLTANEKFDLADSVLSVFKSEFRQSPYPYIYYAANYINKKFSLNSLGYENQIYYNLTKANFLADSLIIADKGNIRNYYAKAITLGYWAYFEGLKGNYFSAYDYGKDALKYYDICLKIEPNFTDAIIANAIYEYWISEKLGWLPFVPDNRNIAIEKLKKSVSKESYNRNIAVVSLFWILMNEKKFNEAKKLIGKQVKKYPGNRYLIMAYANVEKNFNLQKSIELYKKALKLTLSKKRENKINEIILRHKIAMLEFKLKNYENVLEQCEKILSYNLNNYENERLKNRIDKIKILIKDAERRKENIAGKN